MALSDRWTRTQIRTSIRNEILDPNSKWWTDAELNQYTEAWQDRLQDDQEFVWGTSTITTSTSTLTIASSFPAMLRLDAVYWNNKRLSPQTNESLDTYDRGWRVLTAATPVAVYQTDPNSFSFWPTPTQSGTVVCEYPKILTYATDTSTTQIPAWTRYTSIPFVAYHCFRRQGPNHNLTKALRYNARFEKLSNWVEDVHESYFPKYFPRLRPAGKYEFDILTPQPTGLGVNMPAAVLLPVYIDEIPSGTVDGVNLIFTLTKSPNPVLSLKFWSGGLLFTQGTHYTLSSATVTFISPFQPRSGEPIFASYRYLG